MQHPLPNGTRVLSVYGEIDRDEHDILRETPASSIGKIRSSERHPYPQGWTYLVDFPNGAMVFLDQLMEGIDDPRHYQIIAEPAS